MVRSRTKRGACARRRRVSHHACLLPCGKAARLLSLACLWSLSLPSSSSFRLLVQPQQRTSSITSRTLLALITLASSKPSTVTQSCQAVFAECGEYDVLLLGIIRQAGSQAGGVAAEMSAGAGVCTQIHCLVLAASCALAAGGQVAPSIHAS